MTPDDDDAHDEIEPRGDTVRREGGGGAGRGRGRASGEEIDPALRSMRSVWISMREEDPPSGGLTELLAAARAKAEAMTSAPWWQRMFAVLARPPMLAAATVVVLVGGGIVISQRGKDLIEQPTATPSQTRAEPKGTVEVSGDAAGPASGADDSRAVSERDGQAAAMTDTRPPPPPPRRARVKERSPEPALDPMPEPPPPKVDHEGGLTTRAPAGEKLEIATQDSEGETRTSAPETATVRQTSPAPDQRRSGQPPVEQLVKQAEVAASRKDCGAVRVTAKRIKQIDQTVYRERVIKQPEIASCLK